MKLDNKSGLEIRKVFCKPCIWCGGLNEVIENTTCWRFPFKSFEESVFEGKEVARYYYCSDKNSSNNCVDFKKMSNPIDFLIKLFNFLRWD